MEGKCVELTTAVEQRPRWLTLLVLCLGSLMVLTNDCTIYVALPTIRSDLGISEESLLWVVNAYFLTHGCFLLLSGQLGDSYGHQRIFRFAAIVFAVTSLGCGMARTTIMLVCARALQGIAAAAILTTAVSSIMIEFDAPAQRAKAMAIYSSVLAGASSLGLVLGGVLTHALDWRLIFLVNLPIGIGVCCFGGFSRVNAIREGIRRSFDLAGALTITASLLLGLLSALSATNVGWFTAYPLLCMGAAAILLILFILIERRVKTPLVPLSLLRLHNLSVTIIYNVLLSGAFAIWDFILPLYFQRILGYDALKIGLSFLPTTVITAALSAVLSDKLVLRFGYRNPLGIGIVLGAIGLLLLSRTPTTASYVIDVLPGMALIGLSGGMISNAIYLGGLSGVDAGRYGLASAALNSSSLLGGTFMLALVAGHATARNDRIMAAGLPSIVASSYGQALLIASALAVIAALLSRSIRDECRVLRPAKR